MRGEELLRIHDRLHYLEQDNPLAELGSLTLNMRVKQCFLRELQWG